MSSSRAYRLLRWAVPAFGIACMLALAALAGPAADLVRTASSLKAHEPALPTVVVDRRGRTIGEFYEQRRRLISLDEIPPHTIDAFLAAEDAAFHDHRGVDFGAVVRAGWANLRGGRIVQGGSTITQQLAKLLFLTPERTLRRKVQDMALALAMEWRLSKAEILTLYLNEIYLGSGAYGLGAGAEVYFAKPASALTLSESALLAGLPKAPSRLSPLVDPAAAEQRRRYVIERMRDLGFIDDAAADSALADRPRLRAPKTPESFAIAAWFVEEVRRTVTSRLGADAVLRGGLRVETTLDLDLQRKAVAAVRAGLEALERRRGGNAQTEPQTEGALIALAPGGGDVLALVGGYDHRRSRFNRAVQARRQPGSAFKVFAYGAALEAGYPAHATLYDYQVQYRNSSTGGKWRPRNHHGRLRGAVSMHEAFARSLNNASVRLADELGVARVADFARRAGIRSPLSENLSLALGTSEVTLLELTSAYGTFAAGGRILEPRLIDRVVSRDGRVLLDDVPALPAASSAAEISPVDAYLVTHLLRETVRAWYGTGHDAAKLGAVAGKTGSTNENRDAWFVGFSPAVVTGVWVGNDDRAPMGSRETGSRAALPIWTQFMEAAIGDEPARDFVPPTGIVFASRDSVTGERLVSQRPIAGWVPVAEGRKTRTAKYVAPPEPVEPPVAVFVPALTSLFGDGERTDAERGRDGRRMEPPPRAIVVEPRTEGRPSAPWTRPRQHRDASAYGGGDDDDRPN